MTAPSCARLKTACECLSKADPALCRAYDEIGLPHWRTRPKTYETLATTIAYQQISTRAAAKIWSRVTKALPEITPKNMRETSEDDLRALGLSRLKVSHLKSVAAALEIEALNLDRLAKSSSEDARKELMGVKGIGPWTADLYLLYALGEMDAFPAADVGLMEAHKQLSDAKSRMSSKAFTGHAEIWKPFRGVAAHLLWDWLNAQRARA